MNTPRTERSNHSNHAKRSNHSRSIRLILSLLAVAIAIGGSYWLGRQHPGDTPALAAKSERKPLFYRNPMGLPDTSPVPKKDPMGMDYVPVFADEAENQPGESADGKAPSALIKLSTEKIQKLGVKTTPARLQILDKTVRAAGRVEADERAFSTIAPKFEGYIERLHANVTGQAVRKGQPLFDVYSPELVSAQREYALAIEGVEALKGAGGDAQRSMQQLAEASLARLRNWDISDAQIKALRGGLEARRSLTYSAPVNGIVIEKKAVQGMRFMPGEALFQIGDLSTVWVIADVFEQDIGLISKGAKASVRITAYPEKTFEGKVSFIEPTLNAGTRTVPVRIELANPGLLLKPAMFAQVALSVAEKKAVLTVPTSAVIDSGTRQIVLVSTGEGRYDPREVRLGTRGDSDVEILSGVREGEAVVVAANFLIDAESNLTSAIAGFSAATGNAPAAPVVQAHGAQSGHRAEGSIEAIDVSATAITLNHAPVASLKWPAMTMEFKLANPALLKGLKPGAAVAIEFIERGPGEWVITTIMPAPPGKAAAASPHATQATH